MNVFAVAPSANYYDPIKKTDRADATSRADATLRADVRPEQRQQVQKLTPEELAVVQELKSIDRSVRAHEAAHMAAGAGMTSGATFTYQRGPDGGNYAVGGEVRIHSTSGRTPEESIQKARQLRAAALAPADPSGQDRAVASAATAMEQEAMAQSVKLKAEEAAERFKSKSSEVGRAYDVAAERVGTLVDGYA
jgi:hypothetical protein